MAEARRLHYQQSSSNLNFYGQSFQQLQSGSNNLQGPSIPSHQISQLRQAHSMAQSLLVSDVITYRMLRTDSAAVPAGRSTAQPTMAAAASVPAGVQANRKRASWIPLQRRNVPAGWSLGWSFHVRSRFRIEQQPTHAAVHHAGVGWTFLHQRRPSIPRDCVAEIRRKR